MIHPMTTEESAGSSAEDRISALEERLQQLQDQLDIYQLMSTYGPSADSGSGDIIETLFAIDAEYITGIAGINYNSAEEIRTMIESEPLHKELMENGCAHFVTMPVVKVFGDRAVAVCHGQLLRHQDDGFHVWRTSATRWDLVRTSSGWKVAKRRNTLLDGNPEAQNLFREALLENGL
jgi:SnoaL-like domain